MDDDDTEEQIAGSSVNARQNTNGIKNKFAAGSQVNELAVRTGFLNFFVSILLNYRKYLVYTAGNIADSIDNPYWNGFKDDKFLASQDEESVPFFAELIKTQAFAQFVSERISLPNFLSTAVQDTNKHSSGADAYQGDQAHAVAAMAADRQQNEQFNKVFGMTLD